MGSSSGARPMHYKLKLESPVMMMNILYRVGDWNASKKLLQVAVLPSLWITMQVVFYYDICRSTCSLERLTLRIHKQIILTNSILRLSGQVGLTLELNLNMLRWLGPLTRLHMHTVYTHMCPSLVHGQPSWRSLSRNIQGSDETQSR
jgi:hypothetical protein